MNETLAEILDSTGDTALIDIIYLYMLAPITFVGTIFCIANVFIFYRKEFNKPLYDYYRVLSLVYVVHTFFGIFYGICWSPRFMPFLKCVECSFYSVIYIPISSFCIYYSGVIEIFILMDRLKYFSPIVKSLYTITPKRMCLISFIFCFLINVIFFWDYSNLAINWYYYSSSGVLINDTIYIITSSTFAQSNEGSKAFIVFTALRDLFTEIVSVVLNIVSLVYMKRYFKNKATRFHKMRHHFHLHLHHHNHNQNVSKVADSSTRIQEGFSLGETSVTVNTVVKNEPVAAKQVDQLSKKRESEKKASLMVMVLCLIGIISRGTLLLGSICFLFSTAYFVQLLAALADLFTIGSSAISFMIFYHFNKIFKQEFLRVIAVIECKNV